MTMTPMLFIGIILAAIILLTVMTLKLKMHPAICLFLIAALIGIAMGNSVVDTMSMIKSNFGSTLSGIGILIIFGAIIAMGIQDTGAATSIANFFIRLFKGKRLELAPALGGFIMSISVFGDIAIVLFAPISAVLAKRKKISMTVVAPIINLGLTLTHGLVPPTPGILAVSILLNADLGATIFWGLLISVLSFITTYLVGKPLLSRGEFIEPLPEFVENIDVAEENCSIEDLCMKEDNIPSAFSAFAPLLIPALMITVGSFGKMLFEEGTMMFRILSTIGDSILALFCGILAIVFLVPGRLSKVRKSVEQNSPDFDKNPGVIRITFDNWVSRALKVAIVPLIVTAMGGAMGGILRTSPVIEEIGNSVASKGFPTLLIPFILSAILMAVCGSMTTASMTAAGIMAPMLSVLGLSPVIAALSIGAGSMVFWHVNNSGFWVFTSLYNFNAKQGLKYFTTTNAAGGIFAFLYLALFSILGFIK